MALYLSVYILQKKMNVFGKLVGKLNGENLDMSVGIFFFICMIYIKVDVGTWKNNENFMNETIKNANGI